MALSANQLAIFTLLFIVFFPLSVSPFMLPCQVSSAFFGEKCIYLLCVNSGALLALHALIYHPWECLHILLTAIATHH